MIVYAFSLREYPYQLTLKVVTFPFASMTISSDVSYSDGIDHTDSLCVFQKLGNCWVLVTFTTLSLCAEKIFKGILTKFLTKTTTDSLNIKQIWTKNEDTVCITCCKHLKNLATCFGLGK